MHWLLSHLKTVPEIEHDGRFISCVTLAEEGFDAISRAFAARHIESETDLVGAFRNGRRRVAAGKRIGEAACRELLDQMASSDYRVTLFEKAIVALILERARQVHLPLPRRGR